MQSPGGFPGLTEEQVVAIINRQSGGEIMAVRLSLWRDTTERVETAIQADVSPGDTTWPLQSGLNLTKGERIVLGHVPRTFDARVLLEYDRSTGHATVGPSTTFAHSSGAAVYQELPVLRPITGYDWNPGGSVDEHHSNNITRWVDRNGLTVDHDTATRDVSRELRCNINLRDGLEFDPTDVVLRVYVDYFDGQPNDGGGLKLSVPLGVFWPSQQTGSYSSASDSWAITALSAESKIEQQGFENTFACLQGANVVGIMENMLTMDRLPANPVLGADYAGTGQVPSGLWDAGPNFRRSQLHIPYSGTKMGYTRAFGVETASKLAAINAIARSLLYWPLWADSDGRIHTAKAPYWTKAVPKPDWAYDTNQSSIFLDPLLKEYPDLSERPNTVVMISTPNGGAGMRYTAYNTSHESSNSIARLGRSVMKMLQDDFIFDFSTLRERAHLEAQFYGLNDPPVTMKTLLNPLHESHDGYLANYTNARGKRLASTPTSLFIGTGWSVDFSSMPYVQTHKLQKIIRI